LTERDYIQPAVGQSTHRLQEETNVKTESHDISAGATMAYDVCHLGHQSILLVSAGAYFVLLDMGAEHARLKAVVR